ncbi:MAG: hypothetical protein JWM07_220 [Candidatus Saccharibacteria bacterium]|nr:hypothetical protein [Candidatus Saccharibacteria bacterium]
MSSIDTPPSLNQLKQLADIGAKRPRSAVGVTDDMQMKYHTVDKLYGVVVRGESDDLETVRHSMGVRMGVHAVEGTVEVRRLEYREAYTVNYTSESHVKAVTKYQFEWNDEAVLLARRLATFATDQERRHVSDLGDDILRFHLRDDAAAILDAELKFEQMSHEDCERLIADTTSYYAQVDDVNRHSTV